MSDWQPIRTAPIGPTIILLHEPTGTVEAGYGEFSKNSPVPHFMACDPVGFGRFKATHWMPLPRPLARGAAGVA